MKKIFLLMLALLILVGCSSNSNTSNTKTQIVITEDQLKECVTRHEITIDNWQDYFEWQDYHYEEIDAFGEPTGNEADYKIIIPKDKSLIVSQKEDDEIVFRIHVVGYDDIIQSNGFVDVNNFDEEEDENYRYWFIDESFDYSRFPHIETYRKYWYSDDSYEILDYHYDTIEVTKVKGVLLETNVPEEFWNTDTKDKGGYTAEELGRYIIVNDGDSNSQSYRIFYENGYESFNYDDCEVWELDNGFNMEILERSSMLYGD